MRAYILSDDLFFSLGLTVILNNAGYDVFVLDTVGESYFSGCHSSPSMIIIDAYEHNRLTFFQLKGIPEDAHVVFVTSYNDSRTYEDQYFNVFLPRKVPCEQLNIWLEFYLYQEVHYYCRLSECERNVLYSLLGGESPGVIAQKLGISVKTISRHKINAMNKLGVRKMNNKSLIYMSDYVYKVLYLSKVFNGRKAKLHVL